MSHLPRPNFMSQSCCWTVVRSLLSFYTTSSLVHGSCRVSCLYVRFNPRAHCINVVPLGRYWAPNIPSFLKEHESLSASASGPHRTPKPTEKGLAYQEELKRENLAKNYTRTTFFCSQLESQLNSRCFPVQNAPAYLNRLHNRSAQTTSLFKDAQALQIELTELELQN